MADLRDADILQIIARKPRQHRSVDRVVAKGRLVVLQPQATQPSRDFHAAPLSRLDARSSARRTLIRRKRAVLNARIGSTADRRRGAAEGPQTTCAVKRRRVSSGCKAHPASLQPEATGAGMEATKCLKPSDSGHESGDRASVQAAT